MTTNTYLKITALVTGITLASLVTTTAYAMEAKQKEAYRNAEEEKTVEVEKKDDAAVKKADSPVYEVYVTDYSVSMAEREEEPEITTVDITGDMNGRK